MEGKGVEPFMEVQAVIDKGRTSYFRNIHIVGFRAVRGVVETPRRLYVFS